MKSGETLILLSLSTGAASSPIDLFVTPGHFNEDTEDLLLEVCTELVLQFQTKLRSVLGEKYDAKFYTLSVVLEKDRLRATVREIIGVT